jgi:hypothetical protein
MSPRGDILRLADSFSEHQDAAALFMLIVEGVNDHGAWMTANGSHISVAWKEYPTGWSADVPHPNRP